MPGPEQPNLHHTPDHTGMADKLSGFLRRLLPAHKAQMQKDVEEGVKAAEKEEKAVQAAYNNPQQRKP